MMLQSASLQLYKGDKAVSKGASLTEFQRKAFLISQTQLQSPNDKHSVTLTDFNKQTNKSASRNIQAATCYAKTT